MATYNSAVARALEKLLDDQISGLLEILANPVGSNEQGGVPFIQGKISGLRDVKNDLIPQAEEQVDKR